MSFTIDKQTQEDLNLIGKYKKNSMMNLFNQTQTRRGELLLEQMFFLPLQDPEAINKRSSIIRYFQEVNIEFPIPNSLYGKAIPYIESPSGTTLTTVLSTIGKKINFLLIGDTAYNTISTGVLALLEMLKKVHAFVNEIDRPLNPYADRVKELKEIFSEDLLRIINTPVSNLSFVRTLRYDSFFRGSYKSQLDRLLQIISEIDVYISVSKVAQEKKLNYAEALPKASHLNKIEGLFHPSIKSPVPNTVSIDAKENIIFLTGANMAGKSTFMKSFGIATYLAHMGFPVPAKRMSFSVLDGMYTSINVPDNITLGYSHFYAEVLRVKRVAEEVAKAKNMLVIFDELFKGTNVKDAFDATVAVSKAFGKWKNCQYIISTHIVEAGEALKDSNNIQFLYLPTQLINNRPKYTYTLEKGISADRHGMMIINNEHIVEIIKNKSNTLNVD